jgi:cysteine desulfurase
MNKNIIYLDSAATTRIGYHVLEEMKIMMAENFGNPSSLHRLGLDAEMVIRKARTGLADLLECRSGQIFFTGGATESNNWAVQNAWFSRCKKGNVMIASEADHPSILAKLESMKNAGARIELVKVLKTGLINTAHLENILNDKAIFISLLAVNNETGVIQDMDELVSLIKSKAPNCLVHVDASQSFCKLDEAVFRDEFDSMSVSAHKIGGPKGCGAFVVKNPQNLEPLIYGGGQETGKRGGTENVIGIHGFNVAAMQMHKNISINHKKTGLFKKIFEETSASGLQDVIINGKETVTSPYISSISIRGIKGEVLVHSLEENGIIISTGAACSSKKEIYSRVLKAMGIERDYLAGSVRVSYFPDLEEPEIVRAAEIFVKTVKKLRG